MKNKLLLSIIHIISGIEVALLSFPIIIICGLIWLFSGKDYINKSMNYILKWEQILEQKLKDER